MSDPKTEDLAIIERDQFDNLTGDWRYVTDAELEAMGLVSPATALMLDQLDDMMHDQQETIRVMGERLAEWERLGVKVWEDCPMNGTQDGQFWCDDGCADCGGSGKVPADGVQQAANGWWIAPYKMERR